jgi:hypothetical protein
MAHAANHALQVAADAYAAASAECKDASDAADAAYERLQASPDTLAYQIDWTETRKREAAAVFNKRTAAIAYRLAGGHLADERDDRFFQRPL